MRKLIISVLLPTLAFCFLAQVNSVKAITIPSGSPITSPISFFAITGKVTYKNLKLFISALNRITPGANVTITATNFFDPSQVFSTTTDINGNYILPVPNALYKVTASDNANTFFSPPLHVVKIKNQNKNASFQGLIFP